MDIITAIAGLKNVIDILKTFNSSKSDNERQIKTNELNEAINAVLLNAMTAQSEQSKMQEENRTLKEEIARMKQWEAEKKRCKLVCIYDSSLVYALRKDMSNGEIAYYICTSCYENGKCSILNAIPDHKENNGFIVFACPVCKAKVATRMCGISAPEYAEELVRN